MANNGKGKSIYIGTEEEEWDKVLSNSYLLDLVLEGYGGEPIEEHGLDGFKRSTIPARAYGVSTFW
ncbi:hypothetical protein CTI12_AA595260 [Artemisia annua]|uniref:Uncharacterized protein n=1 Tax=Artemisia annua TaxID=35608 RepID=A0A2U1KIK7_ARTAN|nr:hypothetical protein CTI12_AA595260 [Artemisia annua]